MTAPTGHKSPPISVINALSMRRDGRVNEAVALVEAALAEAHAKPLGVAFLDRVQLGLALADLYMATGQQERARKLLVAEADFAEQIYWLTRQSGSPEQIRAASVGRQQLRDRTTQVALVGQPAPEIDVADWVMGRPTTLAEQRGNVVLLEFWASWCRTCLAMFPVLREWHDRYAERGLTIIALTRYGHSPHGDPIAHRARERDMISRTIAGRDLEIAAGIAPDGRLQQKYGAAGIPAFALVDRVGIVRAAAPMADKVELERAIAGLLENQS